MKSIYHNCELNDRVLDKNGKKLGFLEKIINIPNESKKKALRFVVYKHLYLEPSPRLLLKESQIYKIDNSNLYLDVDLEDFEHHYAEAVKARDELVEQAIIHRHKEIIPDLEVHAFEYGEVA
ncbi:MAG: hypothetical protein ACFFDW_07300 [Candidatus Thorarchaeota archaeon]